MSTNTKLAEALRLMIYAFAGTKDVEGGRTLAYKAERAASAALAAHDAEQAQEPVAWRVWRGDSYELFFNEEAAKRRCECFIRKGKPEPLYAAPVEQAARAVPAGWKLVPVEPTPEMLKAADLEHASRGLVSIALISYRAMLAAAPTPPAPEAQRMERLTDGQLSALLKEARKIIRASSSRSLAKDWDRRATQALAGATTGKEPA